MKRADYFKEKMPAIIILTAFAIAGLLTMEDASSEWSIAIPISFAVIGLVIIVYGLFKYKK